MKTIPILPGIALHELRTADAADIFAAIDGERAYLGRWLPFVQFTRSEEEAMRCVAIKCATGNGPSNRIPQRLGFTLDHVEHRAELLEDGRYTDANVYLLNLADRNTSVRP